METSLPPHSRGRCSVCFTPCVGYPSTWLFSTSSASVWPFIWDAWNTTWSQWCLI
ncbi:hypothetical protein SRHO_G00138340, partial [Serrasalmus rhombeus]